MAYIRYIVCSFSINICCFNEVWEYNSFLAQNLNRRWRPSTILVFENLICEHSVPLGCRFSISVPKAYSTLISSELWYVIWTYSVNNWRTLPKSENEDSCDSTASWWPPYPRADMCFINGYNAINIYKDFFSKEIISHESWHSVSLYLFSLNSITDETLVIGRHSSCVCLTQYITET